MADQSKKVLKLFDELIEGGEGIKNTCKRLYFAGNKKTVEPELFETWKTSCLSLLKSTFGSSSSHYDRFINLKFFDYYNSTQIYLGILKGAKSDLEKGYFFHKDLMLSVSIYSSLINRGRDYLQRGNPGRAKVILETVLLEIMTKICENKEVEFTRQDRIPALARKLLAAKIISAPVNQALQSLSGILDQGQAAADDPEDLRSKMDWIQSFLNDYLGSQIMILN